jgi:hypothetical protein
MSILSDIGTKVGAKIKEIANTLNTLESDISITKSEFNMDQYLIGSKNSYTRAVLPLCEIDNSNISKFSYTSGRFDFVRTNGCCSYLPMHIEIKMQKEYNKASPMWFIMHNNLPDNIRPCTFTKNEQLYGGLEIFYTVQGHNCYFNGLSTLHKLYNDTTNIYWEYLDTRDDSIVDEEINNSLVIL